MTNKVIYQLWVSPYIYGKTVTLVLTMLSGLGLWPQATPFSRQVSVTVFYHTNLSAGKYCNKSILIISFVLTGIAFLSFQSTLGWERESS